MSNLGDLFYEDPADFRQAETGLHFQIRFDVPNPRTGTAI